MGPQRHGHFISAQTGRKSKFDVNEALPLSDEHHLESAER
jgi:hypothetical protein